MHQLRVLPHSPAVGHNEHSSRIERPVLNVVASTARHCRNIRHTTSCGTASSGCRILQPSSLLQLQDLAAKFHTLRHVCFDTHFQATSPANHTVLHCLPFSLACGCHHASPTPHAVGTGAVVQCMIARENRLPPAGHTLNIQAYST
jgi:hypothetical protein